jgi:hypothetical protein
VTGTFTPHPFTPNPFSSNLARKILLSRGNLLPFLGSKRVSLEMRTTREGKP